MNIVLLTIALISVKRVPRISIPRIVTSGSVRSLAAPIEHRRRHHILRTHRTMACSGLNSELWGTGGLSLQDMVVLPMSIKIIIRLPWRGVYSQWSHSNPSSGVWFLSDTRQDIPCLLPVDMPEGPIGGHPCLRLHQTMVSLLLEHRLRLANTKSSSLSIKSQVLQPANHE